MHISHHTLPGCTVNLGHTDKFKTLRIQVAFHAPITETTVTARALLPYVLRATCEAYPTRSTLQIQLEDMYAASFGASVRKIGLLQEVSFDMHIIDPVYAMHPSLFVDALAFLHDVLFRPLFDRSVFQEERRLMEEYFQSLYNNKMRYAVHALTDKMYDTQPYRFDAMGLEDDLATITLLGLKREYDAMMTSDSIHINIVGNVADLPVLEWIQTHLPFAPRSTHLTILDPLWNGQPDAATIVIKQDVEQAKLALGYRFPVLYQTEDYYAAVVFNALLGGGPDSLLFKRIREELNMVYFIGSSYDQYKGAMLLYAGIDPGDTSDVQREIEHVISRVIASEYDPSALDIAKTALIQNLVESMDSIGAITSRINHLALFDKTFDQTRLMDRVKHVTRDDVARIARLLQLDTCVVLRREDDE